MDTDEQQGVTGFTAKRKLTSVPKRRRLLRRRSTKQQGRGRPALSNHDVSPCSSARAVMSCLASRCAALFLMFVLIVLPLALA